MYLPTPMPRFVRSLVIASMLFGTASGFGIPTRVVQAKTFTVNSTADTNDPAGCATAAGTCTLRAAITAANVEPDADTIMVPAGIYTLAIPQPNESANASGDLDVHGSLRIVGAGAARTVIDANDIDRVLEIHPDANVEVVGITLRHGRTITGTLTELSGGGIFNAGILALIQSAVRENTTGLVTSGGSGGGIANSGHLTLARTLVSNNRTASGAANSIGSGSPGGDGGGIFNSGHLTLTGSMVNANRTGNGGDALDSILRGAGGPGGKGGGIFNTGPLTITSSIINGNNTGGGGGTVSTRRQTVGGNGGMGGGIATLTTTLTISATRIVANGTGPGGNTNSSVSQSGAGGNGGGIAIGRSDGGPLPGTVTINQSQIGRNRTGSGGTGTKNGNGGRGGGVFVEGSAVDFSQVEIVENLTGAGGSFVYGGDGGGIWSFASTVLLDDALIQDNRTGNGGQSGGYGGGISSSNGVLRLSNATVNANRTGTGAPGGGLAFANGTLEVITSTISANQTGAGRRPSADISPTNGGNGGGIWLGPTVAVSITASTISNNETGAGGAESPDRPPSDNLPGGAGGGLFKEPEGALGSTIELVNATISGNRTAAGGLGGGLVMASSDTVLANVTVVSNTGTLSGGLVSSGAGGAGRVELRNTLLANNLLTDGEPGPDCSGVIVSDGYNLIEDPSGCSITGDQTGLITGEDPLLGPLQDNGGPTSTHLVSSASPAVDAGDPTGCTTADDERLLRVDQRGLDRPVDGDADGDVRCDIGAVEVPLAHVFLPLVFR